METLQDYARKPTVLTVGVCQIQSKGCILETGFEVTEGELGPGGSKNVQRRAIQSRVDLSRKRSIRVVSGSVL